MKTNRFTNWISIAFFCLVLAFIGVLLVVPLLAKGIAQISGDPIAPEKLDVRPIPVPVPPTPVAVNESVTVTTPAPSSVTTLVPRAIPVPIAPMSATRTAPSFEATSPSDAATAIAIPRVNGQGVIVIGLIFFVMLITVWLYRLPGLPSLNGKNAA